MRYEAYLYTKKDGREEYIPDNAGDDIEELISYAAPEGEKSRIYIDNEPDGLDFSMLGFTSEPTREECRARIFKCKLARELEGSIPYKICGLSDPFVDMIVSVFEETERICDRLFENK